MALTAPQPGRAPVIGFGDRLRRLRLDLGLDLRELGHELDVSHATLSRYELSPEPPRAASHIAASAQLRYGHRYPGLDLRLWLLTGDEAPRREPTVSRVQRRGLYAVAS